eukprot:TRINITY_DN3990_c0_g1_i1.p1 TRINITY_DN3990_c0_g1~~TRINITY_DN3990_c0_g1_i1.p1  ORF type:complete len:137 (-),score=11.39 TRINITY_DN3990_c0_g1_i1:71-481(-)
MSYITNFYMKKSLHVRVNEILDTLDKLNLSQEQRQELIECAEGKVIKKYVIQEYVIPHGQCCTVRGYLSENENHEPRLNVGAHQTFSSFGSKRMLVKKKKNQTIISALFSLTLVTSSFFLLVFSSQNFSSERRRRF